MLKIYVSCKKNTLNGKVLKRPGILPGLSNQLRCMNMLSEASSYKILWKQITPNIVGILLDDLGLDFLCSFFKAAVKFIS